MTESAARAFVVPLALAQFIASYAASNMSVAISSIADDLGTTIGGVQLAITLFTLTMASLMIPGSKLTDLWGRKRCFLIGLCIYGSGAVAAAFAPGLPLLIVGYSLLEGVGSALMIPPIYILITVIFSETSKRARYFGVVSASAGLGAAAGPLIGGFITSWIGWRASFLAQALAVGYAIHRTRRAADPPEAADRQPFDVTGAVLSAAGLFAIVLGVQMTGSHGWDSLFPVWTSLALGALILYGFVRHLHAREHAGREPLLATRLFRSKVSNLGLATQLIQWLTLQGGFFVISVFLQRVWGYDAIGTGLMLTPATVGILAASAAAARMAARRSQRTLVAGGFAVSFLGTALLLVFVREDPSPWTFVPGLLILGSGVGVMLTASVNVVQSAFGEQDQGEISGLSRSASNLGSSLGVALVGSIMVAASQPDGRPYALSLVVLQAIALLGLAAALCLPRPSRR
ncbi:MFS transporter [Actinocorallia longicatena]